MSKLGIDIHGVIDARPDMFSALSHEVKSNGHEVHILTGAKITPEMIEELKSYDIAYDNIFSILDHHEKEKVEDIWQDSRNNWWVKDEVWNKTKGIYCKENGIDFHIDDTVIYEKDFETPFALFLPMQYEIHYDEKLESNPFVEEVTSILYHKYEDFGFLVRKNIFNEIKYEKYGYTYQ